MYLIDTNVVSEARKRDKINRGVARFFETERERMGTLYTSA